MRLLLEKDFSLFIHFPNYTFIDLTLFWHRLKIQKNILLKTIHFNK